jgi:hypothetical protein
MPSVRAPHGGHVKKITTAVRSWRLFRPMTFEEAKTLCRALSESMIREHELAMKAAPPSGCAFTR